MTSAERICGEHANTILISILGTTPLKDASRRWEKPTMY
jgi:hypothetical protein